jgi:thiamine pyrophosphate-dependent acetolactate synthase large subunit-like protein
MNGKTAIAKILRIEGVEFVSCLPENPLIDACVAVGIRPIITRTERAAVNIADGFSRTDPKGRVGVCIVQYGPGIENSFAGVAQAYGDSVPILILPGRWSRRRSTSPPDFDAVLSFSRVTKWAAQVNFADRAPSLLRRAFTAFRAGRPGPVLLEVPADVAEEEFDDRFFDYEAVPSVKPGPDPAAVADALNLLFTARRPLLLAGQGIHFSRAWDELRSFAELLNLPVVTSMGGKSSFP